MLNIDGFNMMNLMSGSLGNTGSNDSNGIEYIDLNDIVNPMAPKELVDFLLHNNTAEPSERISFCPKRAAMMATAQRARANGNLDQAVGLEYQILNYDMGLVRFKWTKNLKYVKIVANLPN
jgi:hypothetical protein